MNIKKLSIVGIIGFLILIILLILNYSTESTSKPQNNGISEWEGTVDGIIDENSGITCEGKGVIIVDGKCVNPGR